jgi:hypothetical protein
LTLGDVLTAAGAFAEEELLAVLTDGELAELPVVAATADLAAEEAVAVVVAAAVAVLVAVAVVVVVGELVVELVPELCCLNGSRAGPVSRELVETD